MSMLQDPMYAAAIAAAITLIAKWLDNRITARKGSLVSYMKSALFSAGLVGAWVYVLKNPEQAREATRRFTAPVKFPSGF